MVLTNMFLYPKCFTFLFQTDSSLSLARNQFFVSPVKLAQLPISHFQNFLPTNPVIISLYFTLEPWTVIFFKLTSSPQNR